MEDLTTLEKELQRLKKKERKGLCKTVILFLLFVVLVIFVYDLFQDLEAQKALVSQYESQIKKLETENQTLQEDLLQCRQRLGILQGGEDGRDSEP